MPAIEQLPSREHYALSGFYQKAAGEGIQYYDETGASLGEKITANTTIYADWSQVQYPMTFNQTRGTGGTTSSWTTGTDGTLPEITVPTKEGYRFKGYFTETYGGGTKYYEEDGTPSALKMTKVSGITLYASWESAVYDITYTGMEGATNGTGNPATFTFGMPLKITNPVKEGYTFVGWSVNGSTRRYKDFTVTASDTEYAMDLILEATWMKAAETAVETQVEGVATNTAEINEALAQAFSYIVARDEDGVTVQDMTGEKRIKLTLTVKPADSQTDVEQIEGMAQGTALQFYEIKVKKEVITIGDEANPVITDLKEFPVPITIRISATGELDDKPSYAVYRVHDAIAEKLPVATETSGEYYDVANNEIVISTRKFSTYGVVASEKAITNDGGYVTDFAGGQEVDVQGRMVEQAPDKVYKMDMSWGDMKFEYSVNREWDASAHMYTDGALNDWRIQSYEEGNNRVQVLNHSNTDVRVNMNVQSNLEGVGMGLHIYNEQTAEEAQYFILEDAPEGSLTSQLLPCDAYLYLQGSPTKTWLDANKDTFVNVGNITVTVEAYLNE
ncbi:MAG: InlB B-repeat-containing protein [Lachnospiraceae bacterium]|nr:InlB B-repeat-containing protein [Lachnospiraceae bacterium]